MTRRHKAPEIVAKLKRAEQLVASGRRISDCVGEIVVTEVTYYRWRSRYGNIESDLAEHLTELETEVAWLRRVVSDLTMDKLILVEATTAALSPELRAACVQHAEAVMGVSERRACQALGQHRSTQRKIRLRLESQQLAHQRRSEDERLVSRNSRPKHSDSAMRSGAELLLGEGTDPDHGLV